jgi:hypothetical protein
MTTAPENYGNGSAKTDDRFAAQLSGYRPAARRDSSVVLPIDGTSATDELSPRDLSPRNGSVPSIDRISGPLDTANPIASSMTAPKLVEPELTDLGTLRESVFNTDTWLDSPSGSMVDHPLLRGLLLELPPKGSMPTDEWLDRWFEAARSILELLYAQNAAR